MVLPEAFITRTKDLLCDEWSDFEKALNEESPVSIRINPRKANPDILKDILSLSEPINWTKEGYYLNNRPSFTLDPLFHAGCYYVQEASSMILEYFVINYFPKPAKVLDLCAAPGGKSTHLSSLLPEESLLVANETVRSRAGILSENLIKWGNPNTIVTQNDPADIGKSLPLFFDVIVADLPCSGEGMFRKNPSSIAEWSLNNVKHCAERQRRIVIDIWKALKPGGIFIYSTCTCNREENEENLEWICKNLNAELLQEPLRMMPHKVKGEGFFIAGMMKRGEGNRVKSNSSQVAERSRSITRHASTSLSNLSPVTRHLSPPTNFTYTTNNSKWIAIPKIHFADYLCIKKYLRVLNAGVTLGETKGQDLIPSHELAMSNSLSKTVFPVFEVDKETALNYLRKDSLQIIPNELLKGFILITYKHIPLGFIKNIGTRINNLYPQEWRIRKKNF